MGYDSRQRSWSDFYFGLDSPCYYDRVLVHADDLHSVHHGGMFFTCQHILEVMRLIPVGFR